MTSPRHEVSPGVLKKAMHLLDQQMWLWGCDIKHPQGNLLTEYGFRRIPNPDPSSSNSSVYRLELDRHSRVILRGFAVFFGKDFLGGLLFKRFDSQPYRTPATDLADLPFTKFDLPTLGRYGDESQEFCQLASGLFQWIANYDSWVKENFGTGYIEDCLKSRGKQPAVPAIQAESTWLELAAL